MASSDSYLFRSRTGSVVVAVGGGAQGCTRCILTTTGDASPLSEVFLTTLFSDLDDLVLAVASQRIGISEPVLGLPVCAAMLRDITFCHLYATGLIAEQSEVKRFSR